MWNIFKEHLDYVLNKATRATHKVQNTQLSAPPPELCLKLFQPLLLPITEYGNEIWSAGMNMDSIDVFQAKFMKRVLKLRPQTPTFLF